MHTATTARQILLVASLMLVGIGALGHLGYERYLAERPIPPPALDSPARISEPRSPRVVLVILDSLREDAANDPVVSPTFRRMAADGVGGIHITQPMTLTTMSVVNIATGLTPSISWSLKNFDAEPFQDESLFSIASEAGLGIALLGDASWTQLFGRYAQRSLAWRDTGFYAWSEGGITSNDEETLAAAALALADPSIQLVVIHLTSSDKAAHRGGGHLYEEDGSLSGYAKAVQSQDQEIGRLYERYGERSTWFLLSDHGCTLRGNHGGGDPESRRAPFAWAGVGIRKQSQPLEQRLNAVAPTVAALLGLRAPRTAEVAAPYEVLDSHSDVIQAHADAHVATRTVWLKGLQKEAADTHRPAPHPDPQEAIGPALRTIAEQAKRADEGRGWMLWLGLCLGLLMQWGVLRWILHAAGVRSPGWSAVAWLPLVGLLLWATEWQFHIIQIFGEVTRSFADALFRGGELLLLLGAGILAARFFPRKQLGAWYLWALVVLAVGQSIMVWPFGPLPNMYRAMILTGLAVALPWSQDRRRLLVCALLTAALYAWIRDDLTEALSLKVEHTVLFSRANLLLCLAVGGLAWESLRQQRTVGLWSGMAGLLFLSIAFCTTREPWLLWSLLCFAPLLVGYLYGYSLPAAVTRNIVLSLGLILYRSLAIDPRLELLLGVTLVAWLLSEVRTKNTPLTTPAIACMVLLGHLSYFYEAGFAYAFSSLDMDVAFAATRDAIDLGEGFLFLLVQALGPWLILCVAALYNRVLNKDPAGAQALLIALIGMFAFHSFGAFASFELRLDNHWFTMHAVPVVVFSLCNTGLLSVALLVCAPVLCHLSAPDPLDSLHLTDVS